MTNRDNKGQNDQQRYIEIDGAMIPVTEEVYKAFKQPAWAESQRKKRESRCRIADKRCMEDCSKCPHKRSGTPYSIEAMMDDGLDIPDPAAGVEEVVLLGTLYGELRRALQNLPEDDRAIMELFGEGLSDRKIAERIGRPQTTVSYRRKAVFRALREQLKNYR